MESVFLINPRKRKRKGRMPAGLARYWASRRGGGKRKRRRARAVMTNPHRRRRRNPRRAHHRTHRRRNPMSRKRRHRHRNPIFASRRRKRRRNPFSTSEIKDMLMPAVIGAGGAVVVSAVYNAVSSSLPTQLSTGYMPALVQAAAAIGIGLLAEKFAGKSTGAAVAVGGLTVVLYNTIAPMISSGTGLQGLGNLGRVGDLVPYRRGVGAYQATPSGRAAQQRGMGRLGFVSPAPGLRGIGAYMRGVGPSDQSGGSGFNGLNDGM